MTRGVGLSIKPFVARVVFGEDDDEDFHFAQGAVAGAGADEDAQTRTDGDDVVIELHAGVGTALEEVIRFGEALVVVHLGVSGNIGDVNRGWVIGDALKRAVRRTAGAPNARDGGEIDDFVSFAGGHDLTPFLVAKLWPDRIDVGEDKVIYLRGTSNYLHRACAIAMSP